MKKKIFFIVVILIFAPFAYKAQVRRNLRRCPIGSMLFFRPNGSFVNVRTIIKEPGK